MRATLSLILCLILYLAGASSAWAQPATPAQTTAPLLKATLIASAPAPKAPVEQRAERVQVEDAGARIDELRIGGETRTIEVQPKGGMPAYQIQPTSGERSWTVLEF